MVHYRIRYLTLGIQSLEANYHYIKYQLCNPIAAMNFYFKYYEKIKILKDFPYACPKFRSSNYRYFVFKKWIILYEIKDDIVFIQQIFHSKQNWYSKKIYS